jgi:cytidylate kinase
VSDVARIPAVRVALNDAFRRLISQSTSPGIVVEGRDITTGRRARCARSASC